METSAKTAMNVNDIFLAIGECCCWWICESFLSTPVCYGYDPNYLKFLSKFIRMTLIMKYSAMIIMQPLGTLNK